MIARALSLPVSGSGTQRADMPTVGIVVVGLRTGRLLYADLRTVREATGPDLPVSVDDPDDLVPRLDAAVRSAVPAGVPVVLAGHPGAVERLCNDGRLLDLVVATVPGHHQHTAPAILRSHALRVLRHRSPADHHAGRR